MGGDTNDWLEGFVDWWENGKISIGGMVFHIDPDTLYP